MLAGGAEAAVIPSGVGGFIACRALSSRNEDPTKASRPWDKDRDGFVMGEGAGTSLYTSGCLSVCLPMATSGAAVACLPKDPQAVAVAQMQPHCWFGSQDLMLVVQSATVAFRPCKYSNLR